MRRRFQYPRDEHGDALCHHGRPIRCLECVADDEAKDGPDVQAAGSPVAASPDGQTKSLLEQLSEAQQEIERLTKLAYIGEHFYPDLTYKTRLEEVRGDLEASERVSLSLRAGLERYGQHPSTCKKWWHHQIEGSILQPDRECTCGLDALLAPPSQPTPEEERG